MILFAAGTASRKFSSLPRAFTRDSDMASKFWMRLSDFAASSCVVPAIAISPKEISSRQVTHMKCLCHVSLHLDRLFHLPPPNLLSAPRLPIALGASPTWPTPCTIATAPTTVTHPVIWTVAALTICPPPPPPPAGLGVSSQGSPLPHGVALRGLGVSAWR